MLDNLPKVSLFIKGEKAYYQVPWTPLRIADRHHVALCVPSLAGIYQIFWEDEKKFLHLYELEPAWYGGLRAKLAEALDVDYERNPLRKAILLDKKLYFRYVLTDSWSDIQDLMCIFLQILRPNLPKVPSSGRFRYLHLQENPLVF